MGKMTPSCSAARAPRGHSVAARLLEWALVPAPSQTLGTHRPTLGFRVFCKMRQSSCLIPQTTSMFSEP